MSNYRNIVEELKTNGYNFEFGEYLSEGWKTFTSNAGGFIGFSIVYFITHGTLTYFGESPYIGFVFTLGSYVVSSVLFAGYFSAAHKINQNKEPQFDVFFSNFVHIGKLTLLFVLNSIILYVPVLLFFVPVFLSVGFDNLADWPSSVIGLGTLPISLFMAIGLSIVYLVFVTIAYSFSVHFIIFCEMGPWEAMEASRKVVIKNWLYFFVQYIIFFFIILLGILTLFLGLLVAIPLIACIQYVSFKHIVLDRHIEEDDLLDHLVDDTLNI